MDLRIVNGEVVDPAAGAMSENKTVHVSGGKIAPASAQNAEVINAAGCVVMPGGVDIHTHIAGPLFTAAMTAQTGSPPTPDEINERLRKTGVDYLLMGYTTVVEPAAPLAFAMQAHGHLARIPVLDKAMLVQAVLNEPVLRLIEKRDIARLSKILGWMVESSKSLSIKLTDPAADFKISPVEIIVSMADAVRRLGLPHPLHVHLNDLGAAAGHTAAVETVKALAGIPAHIAHLQFHCHGGSGGTPRSEAGRVAEAVNKNPNVTFDAGHIVFGPTVTVTSDSTFGPKLARITGKSAVEQGTGLGGGCFAQRYEYKASSLVNSMQWACGLELMLLAEDPWRAFLSTDHPNGGSFTSYPYIIRLLMDESFRKHETGKINPRGLALTSLPSIRREYSLGEIAVITRSGPARRLGLDNKGSLAAGADADIAIYRKDGDYEKMFTKAEWVIKAGLVVVRNGAVVDSPPGKTFYAPPLESFAEIPAEFASYPELADRERFPVTAGMLPWGKPVGG
ncbi:MAG: formylmethanofuran dehydrogenase subunit A [Nitrospinae bacterium]|nr:formylmethanofuran dehydrogenase subunit A [Nitrospinota bacterium]